MERHVEDTIAGGTWIFLGSLAVSLTGLVFWIVIARLVGVESLGVASAIVSSSSIAVTLTSAGLNIAVMREVAARGVKAFTASMMLASIMGITAALIAAILTYGVGYQELIPISSLLALTALISIPLLFTLVGFEKFRNYFTVVLTGSLAKMFVGIILAILGLKILAPLIGYLAYPITSSIIALAILTSIIRRSDNVGIDRDELRSVALLTFSNYPYVFSTQLLTMLSVYVFAYLVGRAVPTGTLYITLMITLAIAAIPTSLLSAALPISTKRDVDPFAESFRIGLGLATPVIAIVLAAPTTILQIINPELTHGVDTLRILLLSITPLTALTAVIIKLNKEGRKSTLALIGVARLSVLLALLPALTSMAGLNGAAVAFLLANTLVLTYALRREPSITKTLLTLWCIQVLIASITYFIHVNEVFLAIIAPLIALTLTHITNTFTIKDLDVTLRIVMRALLHMT